MDFDTFDTDLWSEIQDAPGEIFDIDEAKEDEQTWNEFINGNVTVWQVAQGAPKIRSGCLKINKSTTDTLWLLSPFKLPKFDLILMT